jgi:hypothetical protein
MENIEIKKDQIEKFYKTFNPNFIGIFKNSMENGKWKLNPFNNGQYINRFEDFLEICEKYNNESYTIFSCYRRLKPGMNSKNQDDVIEHKYFFVDIDEKDEELKFEKFINKNNLKYTYKVCSGGGFHYYFETNKIDLISEDIREIERLKTASSLFRDWFVDNEIRIDKKVIDLARYTRIWGTYNYKRDNYCELIEEKTLSTETIDYNTKLIFNLKPKYNLEFKSPHTKCSHCNFIEKAFEHNFEKENPESYINDVLLKNAAAYIFENNGSLREAKALTLIQGHTIVEIEGWFKKCENNEIKFNCLELRKFCKNNFENHFKNTCMKCMLENKNKVIYLNDESYNYKDLKEEYRITGKWPVNKHYKLKGIIEEENQNKKSFQICKKYKIENLDTENTDDETLELKDLDNLNNKDNIAIRYFDEYDDLKNDKKYKVKPKILEKINADFFIYNFIVNKKKYKLLSEIELEQGEAIVEGNITQIDDKYVLGDETKIDIVTYLIFAHTVQSSVTKYDTWEEVFEDFNYTEKTISNYIFYKKDDERDRYILEYPELFKWLVKSFLFSGRLNKYPLHLVIVGPQGTGKSWLNIALIQKFNENVSMIGGGNVSIKAFVPSAPHGNYNRGYLYSARQLLAVDEMFNIFLKAQNEEDGFVNIQKFNNILENLSITTGTAFGSHTENMTAKSIWVSNPIDKSHLNFETSINSFPASSMQRFLFFNMGSQFIEFLRNIKLDKIKEDIDINKNKWIMLINFFQDFNSEIYYDSDKLFSIIERMRNYCPENLLHLYETRLMNHHAVLLFDGLVKWRVLFEKDKTLTAKNEDYLLFESLWEYVIKSWRSNNVNLLSKNENILLNMIESEGVHRTTLIRRAEKVFNIDDDKTKIISNMIKDLRNYNLIENGIKSDSDKHILYRIKEKELNIDDLDKDQLKLNF